MADSLQVKISPTTVVVGLVFFTAHLAFDLLNGFALFSLAGWGLTICVFLQILGGFVLFFFPPPRRKPSLLLFSVSLILHPQLVRKSIGVTPAFQGDKSCRRQGLLFKVQYLEEEFLLPNGDSPREK